MIHFIPGLISLPLSFLRFTYHVGPWRSREWKVAGETLWEMGEEVRIYTKEGEEELRSSLISLFQLHISVSRSLLCTQWMATLKGRHTHKRNAYIKEVQNFIPIDLLLWPKLTLK